jgi:hypothetical protein
MVLLPNPAGFPATVYRLCRNSAILMAQALPLGNILRRAAMLDRRLPVDLNQRGDRGFC